MACDRTSEFLSLAQRFQDSQKQQQQQRPLERPQGKKIALAIQVSKDLHAVAQHIAELAKLTRSQSPFDSTHQRGSELAHLIKGEMGRIQQVLSDFAAQAKGTEHEKSMTQTMRGQLADTSRAYASALKQRTTQLREHAARQVKWGARPPLPVVDLQQPQQQLEVTIAMPASVERSLFVERAEQIRDIEANMAQVQQVYVQLAELADAQREQIQRIDDQVMESAHHAERAHLELLTYLAHVTSNRGLILQLFGVLLLFIILFVLFAV